MSYYLLTFRSLTFGQRAKKFLERDSITAYMMRIPKVLAENGCGYCIKIKEKDLVAALELLNRVNIKPVRVYEITEYGYEKIEFDLFW